MRKIILLCAFLAFTSCGGDEEPECQNCDYDGGGVITLCNNLNGTATVTLPGEAPEEVNLNGISFQSYISNLESQGIISCD